MLKEKLKNNKNFQKITAIYLILLISNIVLLIGLIYYYSKVNIKIEIETIDDLFTILATILILAFISSRLPKLRNRGSSLYDIGYLVIITVVGLMSSYFNSNVDDAMIFGPFLEMFKVLSVIILFIILASKLKPFKEILHGKFSKKNLIICLIIFIALGLFASRFHTYIGDTPANVRCMVVMISGLFGGPFIGIPVGLISGAYRFTLGGVTAVPCAISTVISGIIGSLIFIWNDRKFPKTLSAILLMFLFTGFEMLMIVIMTPPNISFPFIHSVYPMMLFASVIGIILFSIVIKEERQKSDSSLSHEEKKILELENELEKTNEKVEKLENEIEELKK